MKAADDDEVAPRRPWAFECPYGTVATPDPATNKTEKPNCGRVCNSGPTGNIDCASVAIWRCVARAAAAASQRPATAVFTARSTGTRRSTPRRTCASRTTTRSTRGSKRCGSTPTRATTGRQWDIARLAFPTHIDAVGKHIVHWAWRGRDCIDVDVPDSTPVADTSAAIYGYKACTSRVIRIDHAQVPKDGYTLG